VIERWNATRQLEILAQILGVTENASCSSMRRRDPLRQCGRRAVLALHTRQPLARRSTTVRAALWDLLIRGRGAPRRRREDPPGNPRAGGRQSLGDRDRRLSGLGAWATPWWSCHTCTSRSGGAPRPAPALSDLAARGGGGGLSCTVSRRARSPNDWRSPSTPSRTTSSTPTPSWASPPAPAGLASHRQRAIPL